VIPVEGIESPEALIDRVPRSGAGIARVVEVIGVAAGDAHADVDSFPVLTQGRLRVVFLRLTYDALSVLEQRPLVIDLLFLRFDSILEALDELSHLCELFLDLGAGKRRPGNEQTRCRQADQRLSHHHRVLRKTT
jgi:hypothetical protein